MSQSPPFLAQCQSVFRILDLWFGLFLNLDLFWYWFGRRPRLVIAVITVVLFRSKDGLVRLTMVNNRIDILLLLCFFANYLGFAFLTLERLLFLHRKTILIIRRFHFLLLLHEILSGAGRTQADDEGLLLVGKGDGA